MKKLKFRIDRNIKLWVIFPTIFIDFSENECGIVFLKRAWFVELVSSDTAQQGG